MPNLDEKFRHIGIAQVHEGDPFEIYRSHIENTDELPKLGYGMSGVLRKMYGGLEDSSFSEIFEKEENEIGDLTQLSDEEIEAAGLCHPEADHFRGVMKMGVISQQLYFLPR